MTTVAYGLPFRKIGSRTGTIEWGSRVTTRNHYQSKKKNEKMKTSRREKKLLFPNYGFSHTIMILFSWYKELKLGSGDLNELQDFTGFKTFQ